MKPRFPTVTSATPNDNAPVPVDLFPSRPAWHQYAACRGTMHDGKSLWFAHEASKTDLAKIICVTCPVRVECSAAGITEYGVWGAAIRKQRPRGRVDWRYVERDERGHFIPKDGGQC